MYIRFAPNFTPTSPNLTILPSASQNQLLYTTLHPSNSLTINVTRAFPETFTSDDIFNEIASIQQFLLGESGILLIFGLNSSGKTFNFIAILTRFLQILSNFQLKFNEKTYKFADFASKSEISQILTEAQTSLKSGLNAQFLHQNATFNLIIAPSYDQKNLQFYQAISHPKIYLKTSKILQNLPISQVFINGKYSRNLNFLACLHYDQNANSRELAQPCSILSFLQFLEQNIVSKLWKKVEGSEANSVYQNSNIIAQTLRTRLSAAEAEIEQISSILDSERSRFRAEIKNLSEELLAEKELNQAVQSVNFALKNENEMLRQENEQIQQVGAFAFEKIREQSQRQSVGSLRERASLIKKPVELEDLKFESQVGERRKIRYTNVEEM